MKNKLKIISSILLSAVLLSNSVTAFAEKEIDYIHDWVYRPYSDDTFTVESDAFTYTTSDYGINLKNVQNDINFMVSGIARHADGSIDYLIFTYVVTEKSGWGRCIGWAEQLCENEASGTYHMEDIRVGDLFKINDCIATTGIPSVMSINGGVNYIGYGEDVFGKDFRKVIRHEWIFEPTCSWTEPDGGFDIIDNIIMGDVTEDESVDILDVVSVNKAVLGKQSIYGYTNFVADINKNGTLDASDSLSIMKYIVGITDTLAE